ncbi:MAG: FAD-dependent oxidoreductase [Acetobacteraceae bacterium]|nr:FAD-dependent oxidoreductase [Acetobacteraceae bacterium]
MPQRILVIGGGFAGLWAAAGAARALDAADVPPEQVEIALVNPDPFHAIRVRCYEAALDPARVPLDAVLGPIGVRRIEGMASAIDTGRRAVTLRDRTVLAYDRLILAAGSQLWRPPVPGLAEHGFDVDTLVGAARLAAHMDALGEPGEGAWSAIVIGGGLVGIEIACELRERLGAARARAGLPDNAAAIRVLLLDHAAEPGAGMGAAALPAIRAAFAATGVTARGGARVAAVDEAGVMLEGGERIAARTVIAATGMRASPLAALLPESLARDRLGRLKVDGFLQVAALPGVFAAGDIACAAADDLGHETVMSCQHARPMGRIAGHNAACDLLGRAGDRVRFAAPDYVTILDLGSWGAVHTGGWDRAALVASGAEAKAVKQRINAQRIYPPPGGDRAAILEAAAPVIQAAPATRGTR